MTARLPVLALLTAFSAALAQTSSPGKSPVPHAPASEQTKGAHGLPAATFAELAQVAPPLTGGVSRTYLWQGVSVVNRPVSDASRQLVIASHTEDAVTLEGAYDYRVALVKWSGTDALWVQATSGGNGCCLRDFVFTRQGGVLRNRLVFGGDQAGVMGLRDLDGDGVPEAVVYAPAEFTDLARAVAPNAVMVLAWDEAQGRFVNATSRFAANGPEAAMRAQRSNAYAAYLARDAQAARAGALGYLVNAALLGQEEVAWTWLQRWTTLEVRGWLEGYREQIAAFVPNLTGRIGVTEARVLQMGEP
ncbi:hypothetical protein HNR42_002203 [Deinobacterium chartae]|uniref:VCBS repeat-containing protein n=1 Tax=Deinobacterium chartae TaxID=521158 RepID=A0A841I333_9DEIO|nr:hypothetical protein [Deinobacterium chartae]MBB6098768.1 hypothetical protein [Deinobacterium chartae]